MKSVIPPATIIRDWMVSTQTIAFNPPCLQINRTYKVNFTDFDKVLKQVTIFKISI